MMPVRSLSRNLVVLLLFALLLTAPALARQTEPLTVDSVLAQLHQGTSPATIQSRVEQEGGTFDLTIEDVVRLRAAGAPADLIRLMARGGPTPELVEQRPLAEVVEAPPGALTVKQVMRMYEKSVPPDNIVAEIAAKGLKNPPDLEELLAYRSQGVPEVILRALAGETPTPPVPAPSRQAPPLATREVIGMLERGKPPAAIVSEIAQRGMRAAPTLDEALALRKSGATDEILAAINDASPVETDPETDDTAAAEEAVVEEARPVMALVPPAPGDDRVLIVSVPQGARVYVAPARTRLQEAFRHDYLMGRTPLSVSLPPGDYRVLVQKEAGEFDLNLVPAWRTLHDSAATRSLLDDADLTFDPTSCCLPGSLTGRVELRSVPADLPSGIIGDLFNGMTPYLFDGESLQVLQVRKSRIRHIMKAYSMRKNPGQPRLLVSTFIPSEGDPLDQESIVGLPDGTPFDPYVDGEALEVMARPADAAALASVLGVQPDHLADAVSMMRRAGKAILHQQVDGGLRLLALSLDDGGRLKLTDQVVRPVNPFAPPAVSKKKKKAPPPPPPLPPAQREVVPGLGLPRLVLDNKSPKGLGLLLSDGQFCFVPAMTRREFVVDPGTFSARIVAGAPPAVSPQGTIHFSYHARYTMGF